MSISEHGFNPLPHAPNTTKTVEVLQTQEIIYDSKNSLDNIEKETKKPIKEESEKKPLKSNVLGASFMLTNICLGTTIFTFAVKAKSFGLVWFILCCILVAIVNYWTITRGVIASSKCPDVDDFSEITEKIMGRKARVFLNILLILYSYTSIMCFLALIFPLFGRFIQSAFYKDTYLTYDDFADAKWGKAYIKFPFFIGLTFLLCLLCLIKDINKLNFSAYIGVGAVIYTLLVVMIQCNSYYNHYKKNIYDEEDKSTHPNWINFKDAWKSDLDFFKGMANLFTAYACHPGIFPVYAGFKRNYPLNEGVKKMKLSTLFATILTTVLHIVSIVCSFLTDPYTPEDLVIYRKNKGSGKDVFMVISRCFISLSLFFTLPGYYFPLRLSIANVFTKGMISKRFNIIFTFVSCYVCAAIASVYDKILSYLSYIGFISVFICYLIPVLLYLYSKNEKLTKWNNLLELLAVCVLIIIGVAGGIVTIIDDVKN